MVCLYLFDETELVIHSDVYNMNIDKLDSRLATQNRLYALHRIQCSNLHPTGLMTSGAISAFVFIISLLAI